MESLEQNIIEGCSEMWDIYVETEQEFHPLEEEAALAYAVKVELISDRQEQT